MTNSVLLRQKINECGYKLVFVAAKCGLTYYGFLKKLNNETEFKVGEVANLKELLQLTDAEVGAIFFAENVDL